VLAVDAGDFGLYKKDDVLNWPVTEFVASSLPKIHVDAWTPGERELYFGAGSLARLVTLSGSKVVSANIANLKGKLLFPESTIQTVGSLKVGITGISKISFENEPAPPGGRYGDFRFLDPATSLKRAVLSLQRKADLVVVLAHVTRKEADLLTAQIPGIDVIVVGHRPGFVAVEKSGSTMIVQPANDGKQVARAHFTVDAGGTIVDYKGHEDTLKEDVPVDDQLARDVAAFRAARGIKDPPKATPPAGSGGH